MSSFLTVEDVNSILYEYGCVGIFHEIDTANISNEYDFDGIRYDFCTISRETNGNSYNYTFKVENKLWTGGYYILDGNGDYIDSNASYDGTTKVLSITANTSSVTLVLYLNNIHPSFNFYRFTWKPLNINHIKEMKKNDSNFNAYGGFYLYFEKLKPTLNFVYITVVYDIDNNNSYAMYLTPIEEGSNIFKGEFIIEPYQKIISFKYGRDNIYYFPTTQIYHYPYQLDLVNFGFNNQHKLVLGKKNICVIIPGNIISEINGFSVYCEDIELYSSDYVFWLDLTNKTIEKDMNVRLHTYAKNGLYEWDYNFILPATFLSVDTISSFVSACGNYGTNIFKLDADLTLTNNIHITHDLRIIGQDHTIDLNQFGFILSEGVKVSFENIDFVNGDTAITQNKGTELRLENCSFTNCQSTNYNNLGSCIYCDVDIESLNNPNDFITVIDNCTFIDNQNCILSGGRLTVTNSRLHNTDVDYIDKHNVAFLYQTDGNATLKYNIFDLDYDTDELCSNEQNIGFAQALIQIGTTARVNGATSTQLLEDNKLPFSDNVYQNASHIFAKYYYPQIESCVYTSPILDKEDKAVCYVVTGENWIWKQNVQVTRASWDSQNEIRKITWED